MMFIGTAFGNRGKRTLLPHLTSAAAEPTTKAKTAPLLAILAKHHSYLMLICFSSVCAVL